MCAIPSSFAQNSIENHIAYRNRMIQKNRFDEQEPESDLSRESVLDEILASHKKRQEQPPIPPG
jgi:hypothetical protein